MNRVMFQEYETTRALLRCAAGASDLCEKEYGIVVRTEDLQKFLKGRMLAQDSFPYLTAAERELFISQTCGHCFATIFPPEED